MKTKILAMLLCVAILLSSLPMSVFAEEWKGSEEPEIDAEIRGAESDENGGEAPNEEEPGDNTPTPLPTNEGSGLDLIGEVITTGDNFRIRMNSDEVSYAILEYFGTARKVEVIKEYYGLPITKIGDGAFRNHPDLEEVTLPDTLVYVGESVFDGCSALKYNTIGGGNYIPSYENEYFYFAGAIDKSVETFTVVDGTVIVGAMSLYHYENLKSVIFPTSVIQMGYAAIGWCDALESVTLPFVGMDSKGIFNGQFGWAFGARTFGGNISYVPESLKTVAVLGGEAIAKGAFYGIDHIETLTVPFLGSGVDNEENAYFSYFWNGASYSDNIVPQSLKNVTISGGKLGYGAFYQCTKIETASLLNDITSIEDEALSGCSSLMSVNISKNVSNIGRYAFNNCTSLTNVIFEENSRLTNIGDLAFYGCTSLQSITIPSSVSSIGQRAFNYCSSLKSVYITDLAKWCAISFGSSDANPLYYAHNLYLDDELVTDLVVPNGVVSIGSFAFYNCTPLKSAIFSDSVTSIGISAFNGCSLASVTIGSGVVNIESDAFSNCLLYRVINHSNLNLTIGSSENGYVAYYAKLLIDKNGNTTYKEDGYEYIVTDNDFLFQKKEGIYTLIAYFGNEETVTLPLTIEGNNYSVYKMRGVRKVFLPEGFTSISDHAFDGCGSLTVITIPDSVTSIGEYAFSGCYCEIKWGKNPLITQIGKYSFAKYKGNSLIFPDSIEQIGEYAFYDSSIKNLDIGKNIAKIGNYAFDTSGSSSSSGGFSLWGSIQFETVKYRGTVDQWVQIEFGTGSLSANNNLMASANHLYINGELVEDVVLTNASFISHNAFYGCKSLRSIIIPSSVTNIGSAAFSDCSGLISITIPNSVTSIGSEAFRNCSNLISVIFDTGAKFTSIPKYTFAGCLSLQSIVIPDSVTSIRRYAFENCSSLTHVVLSQHLSLIAYNSFNGCSELDETSRQAIDEAMDAHGDEDEDTCLVAGTLITLSDGSQKNVEEIVEGDMLLTWDFSTGKYSAAPVVFNDAETENDYTIIYVTFSDGTTIGIATEHGFFDVDLGKYVYLDLDAAQYIGHAFINQQGKNVVLENVVIKQEHVAVYSPVTYQALCYYANEMLSVPGGIVGLLNPFVVDTDTMQYDQDKMQEDIEEYGLLDYKDVSNIIPEVLFESFNGQYLSILIGKGYISWDTIYGLMERYLPLCEETTNSNQSEPVLSVSPKRSFAKASASGYSEGLQFTSNGDGTCYVSGIGTCTDTDILIPPTSPTGDSVTSIGTRAFYNSSKLKSVTIPNSVIRIESEAFSECRSMTSVTIPDSVTRIGYEAFWGVSINSVYISDIAKWCAIYFGSNYNYSNPLSHGASLYLNGQLVTDLEIPNGVKSIYSYAFHGCKNLKNVTLPDSLTSIGERAFYRSSLTSITIPNSVTSIGSNVFEDCSSLASFTVAEDNKNFSSVDGILYNKSKTKIIYVPKAIQGSVTIPNGITSFSFSGCNKLTSVTIPNSVTSIGYGAFSSCSSLTSVTIPNNVTSIGSNAFYNCTSLTGITIPNNVTSIGSSAFYNCRSLISIEIPNSVTSIGDSAFSCCTALQCNTYGNAKYLGNANNPYVIIVKATDTSITSCEIHPDTTFIHSAAFSDCTSLTSVTIGYKVSSIGNSAFSNCSKLTNVYIADIAKWCAISFGGISVSANPLSQGANLYINGKLVTDLVIPNSVTSIGGFAFSGCTFLTSVTIPNSVKSIGDYSFYNCASLTSISIPNSVTSLGNHAFDNCRKLTSITIPNSVTSIGSYAFEDCVKLMDVTIPNSLTSISNYAFRSCTSLESIIFPNSITSIGEGAFYDCTSLTGITIPDQVTSIGSSAFYNNSGLTSITIPNSVTSIGNNAFKNCTYLYRVINLSNLNLTIASSEKGYVAYYAKILIDKEGNATYKDDDCEYIVTENDFLFQEKDGSYTLIAYLGNEESVILPLTISGSGYSISNMRGVRNVIIPDGITSIESYAFADCASLIGVTIRNSVTSIGSFAFANCVSLTGIVVPNSVTSIGSSVFSNCTSLTSVIIGNGVTSIGLSLFSNCTSLENIAIAADNSVYHSAGNCIIETSTKTLIVGCNNSIIPNDGSVKSIGYSAFSDCIDLTSIEIPNSVTIIGSSAFLNCTSLASIEIPEGVTNIGSNAFAGCSKLTSVIIPKSVISVGSSAFADCKFLTSVAISDGVTTIGSNAFYGCISLTSVVVPNSVTSIGAQAFGNCSSLKSITIPFVGATKDGTTNTYFGYIFYTTYFGSVNSSIPSSLRTVIITGGKSVDSNAFAGCSKLTSITIPNSVTTIKSNAFANCTSLTSIIYLGEKNEWRHVVKASNWDENTGDYGGVQFKENSGLMIESNEDYTEFWVSGFRKNKENTENVSIDISSGYSGRQVTKIYAKAFNGQSGVASIALPDTITAIGEYAFADCVDLESINLPNGISEISFSIFTGCNSLSDLAIPFLGQSRTNSKTAYLGYLFGAYSATENSNYVPSSLKNITIAYAESVSDYAFYGCSSLQTIALPDMVTSIGDYAFAGCYGIAFIDIPDRVISIGDYAFSACTGLQALVIPDKVTSIGEMILNNCNQVKSITIGASLNEIGEALEDQPLFGLNKSLSSLSQYIVSAGNVNYMTDSYGVLYRTMRIPYKSGDKYIAVSVVDAPIGSNLSGYRLPSHIVKIEPFAFAYHSSLRAMELENIRMICDHAFYEADNLVSVHFGETEKIDSEYWDYIETISYSQYVGDYAFMGCSSLQKVNIETDMLVGIGDQAFYDCGKLNTVIIGKNIQAIGSLAFGKSYNGEASLEKFQVMEGSQHFTAIAGVLYEINEDKTLTLVWYPALLTIGVADGKPIYATEFELPTENDAGEAVEVSSIALYAFSTARMLENIVLDSTCGLTVRDYAFSGTAIQSISIGENVVSLGTKRGEGEYTVFADCNYLTDISVSSANVYYSSIDGVLFNKDQTKLIRYPEAKFGTSFSVPATVSEIASMAFKHSQSLQTITVSSYISSIGVEAFYLCSNLAVVFFDGVYAPRAVMENAFTTYFNPQTTIGYSALKYNDGEKINDYGWSNYEEVYSLQPMTEISDFHVSESNGYYAIVLVDEEGNRVKWSTVDEQGHSNFIVTLTDPNGNSETVYAGVDEDGLGDGIAVFYDLYGAVNLGLSINFDEPYSLRVSDTTGAYYTFISDKFYLDYDMRITYITLVRKPCDLVFHANGGTGSSSTLDIEVGGTYTLPNSSFSRAGYTFLGWGTEADGQVEYTDTFYTDRYKDHFILYAIWEANTNTVHFNANNGTGSMSDFQIKTDEAKQLPTNLFVRDGYEFIGWSETPSGVAEYEDGSTYICGPQSEYTLYAKWRGKENLLILHANGGTGSMDNMTVVTDETYNLDVNTYTRAGYTFAGWAVTADGTVRYLDGGEYTSGTAPVQHLYAVWEANTNTILFNANGGVGTMSAAEGKTDSTISLPLVTYTRSGYLPIGLSNTPNGVLMYTNGGEYKVGTDAQTTLYVVWAKTATVYGVNCGETSINTQTATLNTATYGKIPVVDPNDPLIDPKKGYVEGNIKIQKEISETIDISVIGYYDRGYLTIAQNACGLYQNGIAVPGCTVDQIDENTGTIYFAVPADALKAEVPIEARFAVTNGVSTVCSTALLNINVINFTVDESDVNLDTKDLSVDLSKSGDIIGKLLGSKSWNFNLGDNVSVGVDIDGDTATLSLNAAYSSSKDNTKDQQKKYTTNCEEGYYANLLPHNKGTWFFQKKIVMWENDGIIPHVYTMNIRFVSGTGAFGHYYYRCYIYEGDYKNQKALFYGAISSGNNMGRKICAIKANVIYATYAAKAIEAQDITKGFKYSEPILPKMKLLQDGKVVSRVSSTKQDFSATLYGDIVFQYQAGKGLVPVSSYILGEIRYELLHKEQFVVWVIPIYLEVSVKLDGKIELSLKYDAWRSVSIDEAKMTLSAEITAKVGVGCELISVGVYGTIGTVFILDFAPTFGVEKWTVSGKLALYATFYTLTWKKWGWFWYPTVEQTTKEHTLFEKTWTIIDNTGKTKSRSASTRMLSEMFLAKNYVVDTSENAVAEEARLIQIGNTLYKIYAANRFTESENPDEDDYNYRKIALAKWNETSEEWEFCQFLDDNQFNDLAFDLYQTEDGVAVAFTQQTQMVEEGDDSYSYASNLCVKYAWIDEDGTVTVSELATSGNYKYFSTVSFVDGVPTVVWVENADNNIFGVSPYNYVDATGVSHIYETTANSVWMSQLIDGVWTEATCIQSGLSAVTDLAVTENGYVVYIVDENGDLADISDREAYYKGIESRKIRMLAGDDVTIVTSVGASGNGVIYYCQNDEGETLQFTDLVSNAKLDLPEDASYLTDDYKVIYDETGAPAAILYSDAISWKENDTDCYGSTLYGIFRTETGWGNPVEVTTDLLSPSDNRYVSSFDAMFNEEGLLLFVEYSDRDGNCKAILMDTFTLGSKVSLIDQKVDYAQSLLTVTFENKGTDADGVYAMINGVSRMNVFEVLSSGEKQTETLDLSAYGRNLTITFYNTSDNSLIDTIELDLNHSDLQPIIKQLLLGKNNTLLVAVRNNGNLASDGTLYVVIGNENAETILTNDKTFATSFSAVAQNELIYKEIELSDDLHVDENTIVTIYVVASGNLEKGNCTENNLIYGTLKQFSSAVADDGSSYRPTIDVYQYQFDSQNPKDISIRYSCSESDSIVEILLDGETVSSDFYDLEDQRITLKKEYLATLTSGKEAHTLSLTFATGDTISVELQIPVYYTITWANEDGTILDTTLVKAGQIPDTEVIPTKAEDEYGTYTFTGWMNGAENIKAVDADTTYTAVYLNTAPIYSVTWVMMTDEGEFSVEELYEYGKSYDEEIAASDYVPEYKGTMWVPYGKQFSGWDKVVEPVTEDVVYTAVYTKSKQGTATVTNSAITAVAGKTFTTTVSLEDVHNMTGTTLTISYDATLVTLNHVVTDSKVSVIEKSEGQLILSVTGLSDGATLALADLTFRVVDDLAEGEYDILGVASEEDLTDEMSDMTVVFESDAGLILENRIATVGRTVQVTLFLQNNPGFAYLNVSLDYDHDNLTLIDVKNEASALAFAHGTDILAWDNAEDYLANGKLCTLTFEVSEDAPLGEYAIGLIVNECYDEETDAVNLSAVGGTVNVIDFVYGDVNGDGAVDGKDLIVLRKYLVGADVEIHTGADVNGDGEVDGKDVIILRKYLVGTAQLGPTA